MNSAKTKNKGLKTPFTAIDIFFFQLEGALFYSTNADIIKVVCQNLRLESIVA